MSACESDDKGRDPDTCYQDHSCHSHDSFYILHKDCPFRETQLAICDSASVAHSGVGDNITGRGQESLWKQQENAVREKAVYTEFLESGVKIRYTGQVPARRAVTEMIDPYREQEERRSRKDLAEDREQQKNKRYKDMALLEQWRAYAYDQQADKNKMQAFWADYFEKEKGVYEQLLENPDEEVKGTVKELAEKYGLDIQTMTGFLDGINDSLKVKNPIDTMEEDTEVSLAFDKEMLYKNMVDAKADWLYGLPQWENIFDEETRKQFYLEAKKMNTIVKPKKIGRNEPCPCGSGKKYKQCHGRTKELEAELQQMLAEQEQ